MAAFVYPSGWPGTVPLGYVFDNVEYQLLWDQLVKAPNFEDGGTWSPTGVVTVGGSGFSLTGTGHTVAASARLNVAASGEIRFTNHAGSSGGPIFRIDGTSGDILGYVVNNVAQLDVENGAVLRVKDGGALDVFGSLTLKNTSGPGAITAEANTSITLLSGSDVIAASGSTITVSGDLDVNDGGALTLKAGSNFATNAASGGDPAAYAQFNGETAFAGATTFISGTWPLLSSARTVHRHATSIALCTFNNHAGAGPDDPDLWVKVSNVSTGAMWRTRVATATGDYSILEFEGLPEGATITNVEVDTKGGDATIPTYPTFRIVKWRTGETDPDNVSSAVTDEHSGAGSWDSAVDTTTVTPSSTTTIDRDYRYGIKITHPYAIAGSFFYVYRCEMRLSASAIKV